jgi:hypothetical protein
LEWPPKKRQLFKFTAVRPPAGKEAVLTLKNSAYAYRYGELWDGCSADIDANAMKIRTLKSSVALISRVWCVGLIKEIRARGPIIANGKVGASCNTPLGGLRRVSGTVASSFPQSIS